jgi:predicted Zn finger-like uncharacterized protein
MVENQGQGRAMIVTCDACETNFTVDESRIPSEGIKVRCSKCKHVFLVKKEAPEDFLSELDDFEKFHRDQMDKDGGEETFGGPEERSVLAPEEPPDICFEEFMKTQEPTPVPREAGPSVEEEEVSGGFDIDEEPPAGLMDSDSVETSQAGLEPEEMADEGVSEGAPIEAEETQLSAEAYFREEMEREAAEQNRGRALPSLEEKKFEDLIRGKTARKGPKRPRSALKPILLVILLIVLGLAVYVWWQDQGASLDVIEDALPTVKAGVQKVSDLWDGILGSRGGGLEFSGLQGNEEKIGEHRVYVIRGQVKNTSRRARKYVKLRVIILDHAGNRIKEKMVYCGNVFTRQELEQLSSRFFTGDEILQPKRPKDMVLEAHKTISFMVIFSGLPREGKSFKVENLEAPTV